MKGNLAKASGDCTTNALSGKHQTTNSSDKTTASSALISNSSGPGSEHGSEKSYSDQIDHHYSQALSLDEHQQMSLLPDIDREHKYTVTANTAATSISAKLSAFVPTIIAKSSRKGSIGNKGASGKPERGRSGPTTTKSAATSTAVATAVKAVAAAEAAAAAAAAPPTKTMKKMSQLNGNRSGRRVADGGDVEANAKTPNNRSIFRSCNCYLVLFMAIFLIAISIIVFCPNLLDKESQSLQHNLRLPQDGYKLFSTKTLYSTAWTYLFKSSNLITALPSLEEAGLTQNQSHEHSKARIQLLNPEILDYYIPSMFSPKDSLESLNKKLTSEHGCKVRRLYFVGRHAARLPDKEDIKKINGNLNAVKARIDDLLKSKQDGGEQQAVPKVTNPSNQGLSSDDWLLSLSQASQWKIAEPSQGNLVTEFGAFETFQLASRFKKIFPELFDGGLTNITIGTTNALRTAQTAVSFMKNFNKFTVENCDPNNLPNANTLDESRVADIEVDECLKSILKHEKEMLLFHKLCRGYPKTIKSYGFNLSDSSRFKFIADSVSKRLNLKTQLSYDETRGLYDMCRYKTAQSGLMSDFCRFFSEKELKFYEYAEDVSDFFNSTYGDSKQALSSCQLTNDIMSSFMRAANGPTNEQNKPEAYFYFTHSDVIQKLIAVSVDLSLDGEYQEVKVLEHLKAGTAPPNRKWRTSLMTPFSSNIAFTLYECPKGTEMTEKSVDRTITFHVDNRVKLSNWKVVASLNEKPILLDGCDDYVCDLEQLKFTGRIFQEKFCIPQKVCKDISQIL